MKVVLIQPLAYEKKPSHVWAPLNLGYMAAYLRKHGYSNVKILCGVFVKEKTLLKECMDADIVGFTATSPMFTNGKKLAQKIKEINPKAFVLFGGTHPSSCSHSVIKLPYVDAVILGEGEKTMLDIVKAIDGKMKMSDVGGIAYKEDGKERFTPAQEFINDIDTLPFPARDLLPMEKFIAKNDLGGNYRIVWMLSSRGCPYACTYCASAKVWSRRWRARTAQNIIDEIKELIRDYSIDTVHFADDTFTVNIARVKEFCRLLDSEGIKLRWACNARVDTVDKETLTIMRDAGCYEVWMGVESGSQQIMDDMKKGIKVEQVKQAFKWTKELGIKRHAYFMIGGSPNESLATIKESENLIAEIEPDYTGFTILTPYPGCETFEYAKARGYVKEDQDWSKVDLHDTCVMPTKNLTKEQMLSEQKRLSIKYNQLTREIRLTPSFLITRLKLTPFKEYPHLFRLGLKELRKRIRK